MEMRMRRAEAYRLFNQLNGAFMHTYLMSHESQQIQSVWIVRLSLENSPVDLFRLRQAPGFVVFYAELYGLADGSDLLLGWHSLGFHLCRGSSASRRPSPSRLNESTRRKIESPGQIAIHGAWST